jgi:hypothetical protein
MDYEIDDGVIRAPDIIVNDGKYKLLEFTNVTKDFAAVYKALFTKNDGSTEQRVITIKHNKVLTWHN